ncbi:hypothetical protein Tco_0826722 [Tanacetum coccineum]
MSALRHSGKENKYQDKDCQGRFLAIFQDDAKYEHVGQDTRLQDGKDDQDIQGKDLKISEQKTKSKDYDKSSRSKITQHERTNLQQDKDQDKDSITQRQNNLHNSKEARFKDHASGRLLALKYRVEQGIVIFT